MALYLNTFVLVVQLFDTEEEAVRRANDTVYGLAAYVFTRTGTTWAQRAYLKSPNADAYDEFGSGVAMSGDANTLAIAAFGEDGGSVGAGGNQADNSVRASGAVYVY